MILDNIKNISVYGGLGNKMEKALKYLAETDFEKIDDGKYEIDGEDVFAMVKSYTTDLEKINKWEAHKKYIDIQYIVKGKEIIGWIPENQLSISKEYSEEKDIAFYNAPSDFTSLILTDKYFSVLYPQDAHMPGCACNKPCDIKKVIVKIKID